MSLKHLLSNSLSRAQRHKNDGHKEKSNVLRIFLLFIDVYLFVSIWYVHVCVYIPTEARRGRWIPWNWNCELLNVGAGNRTLILWETARPFIC